MVLQICALEITGRNWQKIAPLKLAALKYFKFLEPRGAVLRFNEIYKRYCVPPSGLIFWFQKIPSKSRAKIDKNGAAAALNTWLLEPSSLNNLQDI